MTVYLRLVYSSVIIATHTLNSQQKTKYRNMMNNKYLSHENDLLNCFHTW